MAHPTKKVPRLAGLDKYHRQGGRVCGVCASPHRKFIEQAFTLGHSKRAISDYLTAEFAVKLPTNLGYHLSCHVTKKA